MSDPSRGFETWWPGRGLHENLKPAFFMVWKAVLESDAAAQLAAPASEPMVPVEEVKSLCRDYSSRTGSVYIKDVESALDALAALYAAPQGAAHD